MRDPTRRELGDFLRKRRQQLSPDAVGVQKRRRRTSGLRREEVAERAGIGIDWYIRLEQGRAVSPSSTTIDALARALRLSKVEHDHLKQLARTGGRPPFVPETVPPRIKRLVESMSQPAYVTGRRWDVLCWNSAADDLLAFSRLAPADRNVLISMLTSAGAKKLFGSAWSDEAKRMVAQFRVTHDLWAGDPAFVALLERLQAGCPEFNKWWQSHDVRNVAAGEKSLQHRKGGKLRLQYASFQSNDDPALRLVLYAAE